MIKNCHYANTSGTVCELKYLIMHPIFYIDITPLLTAQFVCFQLDCVSFQLHCVK